MAFQEDTTHIGDKKKTTGQAVVSYVMEAMPIPTDWGIGPSAAVGKGNMKLIRGKIPFVRLDLALLDVLYSPQGEPEDELPISPVEMDPADRILGKDRKRGVHNRQGSVDLFELEQQLRNRSPFRGGNGEDDYELDEDVQLTKASYRSAKEVEKVRSELDGMCRRTMFNLVEAGVVALFLCLIELLPAFGVPLPSVFTPEGAPVAYLLIELCGLGFTAYIVIKDLISGMKRLIARKFNIRAAVTAAMIAELAHILYMLLSVTLANRPATHSFAAPICLSVTIYTLNRLLHTLRVAKGFGYAARRGIHSEVLAADDSPIAADLRLASGSTNARIAYVVRTRQLHHYFVNACREDSSSAMIARVYPYFLAASVVTAVIGAVRGLFMEGDFLNVAFSALCAAMVTGIPITGLLCLEIPLSHISNQLRRKGALLNGWNAVEKFGDTDAFAINTTELFPRGSIKVRRSFAVAEMEMADITTTAASVLIASGGALAEVFGQLIGDDAKLRENVDGIEYENEMGISAWMREKRILIGNRDMMETHRVLVPNGGLARLDEFEALRKRPGHQVLYVAVNNRLMGVYLLEYKASLSTRNALVRLISDGTNVMIYTCDANINVQLITAVFDVPPRFISILDNEGSRIYDSVTYAVTEQEEALLATDGSLRALSESIRGAVRLKETRRLGMLIQTVCFAMGFLFVAGLSCLSPYAIDPVEIIIMQIVFVLISMISVLRAL